METINSIKNNQELFEKLLKYECKVSYNNKILYEGLFNENIDTKKYNKSQLIYDVNINNNHIIFLGEENKNIEILNKLFEDKEFNEILNNPKLFNKAMNLANNLPLYNFDNRLFENDIKDNIKKYGINFQKIYENLYLEDIIKKQHINEKLKINSKSKINITDSNLSETSKEAKYADDWQFFNNLITDVNIFEDQYRDMFANLSDDEIKVWIKETQDCYVGTEEEDDANNISNYKDLAKFYWNTI